MEKISTVDDLKEAIKKLEQKQAEEWLALKQQSNIAFENAKPSQIFKNAISDVLHAPEPKGEEMWTTALSLTAGYLAKRLVVRKSDSTMTHILGTAVQFGVTNLIANNADVIKLAAARIFDLIITETEKKHDGHHED